MDEAFDVFSLQRVVQDRLGLNLSRAVSPFLPLESQTQAVHNYYHQRNETERLIAALRDARPKVPEFVTFSDQLGFTTLPARQHLEVLIKKGRSPYADVLDFRVELASREAAVCHIETPDGTGTGALVGPDLVLTAHHVVSEIMDDDSQLTKAVVCRFDYKESAGGQVFEGVTVPVSSVAAFRDHAKDDLDPDGDNQAEDKLDYALLKLDRRVGDLPLVAEGEKRGFVKAATRAAEQSDGLLVLQHPDGKPMKIDIGAVTWIGKTRVRHSVNTEPGSSGAPVFDAELNMVAMHHAGNDWPDTKYPHNQAIPMGLIVADAAAQGVRI
jgi:V8-like Glu-specific endopeptidase